MNLCFDPHKSLNSLRPIGGSQFTIYDAGRRDHKATMHFVMKAEHATLFDDWAEAGAAVSAVQQGWPSLIHISTEARLTIYSAGAGTANGVVASVWSQGRSWGIISLSSHGKTSQAGNYGR